MVSTGGAAGLGIAAGLLMNVGQNAESLHNLTRTVEPQIRRDLEELTKTGRLGPVALVPPDKHRPRNQFWTVVKGMLLTGLLVGLPVFLVAAVLQGRATTSGSPLAQGALVGVMWGMFFGIPAAVVPGIFVGLYLQRREIAKRLRSQRQQILGALSEARESIRQRLDRGQISRGEAENEIRSLWPSAVPPRPPAVPHARPLASTPLPTAGQPLAPLAIMMLASACCDRSGGYVNVENGPASTPATVTRMMEDPFAPERGQMVLQRHNEVEALDVFAWTMRADADGDAFRQRVANVAGRPTIASDDRSAVVLIASSVGAFRRARARGLV